MTSPNHRAAGARLSRDRSLASPCPGEARTPANGLRSKFAGIAIAACGLLLGNVPAHALTIVPTFGSSVSAANQAVINNSLSFYEHAFADPITVNIGFNVATGASYAGQSQSSTWYAPYQRNVGLSYTGLMQSDASTYGNTIEQTAYDNLSYGNSARNVVSTTANFRALGCTSSSCAGQLALDGSSGGNLDGIVSLNSSYVNATVIQHEINEVLGIGGSGSVLNTMYANGLTSAPSYPGIGTYINPLDLFRYSAAYTASLTTDGSATAYFSIDGGVTNIVAFNQNSSGDYGDWASGSSCNVQNWQVCSSSLSLDLSSPEVTALQAIGYDAVAPVPAPASILLFASGLFGIGAAGQRRRRLIGER